MGKISGKALVIFGEPDPSKTNPVFYETSRKLADELGENWAFVSTNWVRNVFAIRKRQGIDRRQDQVVYDLLIPFSSSLAKAEYNLIITGVFPHDKDYNLLLREMERLKVVTTSIWIKGCYEPFWMEERERKTHQDFLKTHAAFKRDLVVDFNNYEGDMNDSGKRTDYAFLNLKKLLANRAIVF